MRPFRKRCGDLAQDDMSYSMIHEAGINVLEWPSDEESWTGSLTEAQQEFRGDCRWFVVPLQES